jgi:diguanylate cyclase (GGDEF)-like protein/PAS domain S-box-containing protein
MKLRQKLVSHFLRLADLYRMGSVAAAVVALVLVFGLTQPINLPRHNAMLEHFSHLQNDESRLGEAVLQLNFSLTNNYDQVTGLIEHLRAIVRELREGEVARVLREDEAFMQQLDLLEQRVISKEENLEKFKSRNAVLKNSLLYLPMARDDAVRDLHLNSPARAHLNTLMEQLLINRIRGGHLDRASMESTTAALHHDAESLAPAARQKIDSLVRHIHQIDQLEREMPSLVRQLTSGTRNSGLAQAYASFYNQQQWRATVYRWFLLLATLGLIAYVVRTYVHLREQSNRLELAASVFSTASEGITITNYKGVILDVNAAFSAITGYTRDDVLGENPRVLKSGRQDAVFYQQMWQSIRDTGSWAGEIWNRRKSGEIYPEWLTITTATTRRGGLQERTHYVATFSDISQRKKNEAEIYQLAYYDPLTALPNRRLLTDRLRQVLASRSHSPGQAALLFIDVDHFKTLNDVKGHDMGDLLLVEVSRRLLACAREADTVARLGSDEFVVMLQGLSAESGQTAAQAKSVAEKIRLNLGLPYWLNDFEHVCSCSIGISMSGEGVGAEEMLQHANTAMSDAKNAGRDTLRFFDPMMQSALETRASLESDLRLAIQLQQFELYYQIQVDGDGQAIGAEALVRWNHPQQGLVSPATFIPLAEETGLILPLGQWILETACAQIKSWEAASETQHLVLAVNVSARQLASDEFVTQVEKLLLTTGITPARLKLEITESMMLGNVEAVIRIIRQLKALGVSFSMDDFGTGYSSLQYLKRLPLDQLKIDQSFVRDIGTDSSDQALVGTIVAMARSLHLNTIAEGVETQVQRELLVQHGCHSFQGYLFSRPVPIAGFADVLQRHGRVERAA